MSIYLAKILPLLVLPIGIVFELSLVALVLLVRDRRKPAVLLLVTAMLVLWLASMPMVADALLGRLERAYPAVVLQDIPASRCIVLLGGAVEPVAAPRVAAELLDAADRVRMAARLYAAGKAQVIIVSGGRQPWSAFAESEAQATRTLLVEWGVPATAVVLEEDSRNTRENAVFAIPLIEKQACGRPLLVTSAAHMKRAVASFAKLGMAVFPVSVDVRVFNKPKLTLLDFLPTARALKRTTEALREWMGQGVYVLRGWS